MNNIGELVRARELRLAIYHGGVEPQLRKVVWKHILGVYPSHLNGRERMDYMRQKSAEYEALKSTWIDLAAQGQVPERVKLVTNMIRKDVLRTDRHHKFFASEFLALVLFVMVVAEVVEHWTRHVNYSGSKPVVILAFLT